MQMEDHLWSLLGELRRFRSPKRIRAYCDGKLILDSTSALLIWEPKRVTPVYAIPSAQLQAGLTDAGPMLADEDLARYARRPVYDPSVPFDLHTTPGRRVSIQPDGGHAIQGFVLADPELDELVLIDFDGPDVWFEESEEVGAHPRDPFHRIDALRSDRTVSISMDGIPIARSDRAVFLFETNLPTRYYLPPEDVLVPLTASATRTRCAYKGEASYFSAVVDGTTHGDLVWTYPDPAPEAAGIAGLLAFYPELLELHVGGEAVPSRR